jgi:hypothetical protein
MLDFWPVPRIEILLWDSRGFFMNCKKKRGEKRGNVLLIRDIIPTISGRCAKLSYNN